MKRIWLNRTSIRKYLNKALEFSSISAIKEIINAAPTSNNHQKFSVIFIENKDIKDFISIKNGNQSHIKDAPLFLLFLVDCNRIAFALNNQNFDYNSISQDDDFIVGVIDATIAATMVHDFCLSIGLGVCYIGGVRFYGEELCHLLNIEGKATPILGMTIGYANEKPVIKPKINKVFYELYSKEIVELEMNSYNKKMKSFYIEVYKDNNSDISFFSKIYDHYLLSEKNKNACNFHYKNLFYKNDN